MLQDPLLRAYGVTAPLASSAPEDPGIRMVIESSMVGQLLGRKGRRVQEVKAQTGVRRIQVLTAEESRQEGGVRSERVVLLLGKGDACRRAHLLVSTIFAMDPAELQRRKEEQELLMGHHFQQVQQPPRASQYYILYMQTADA
jgi:predicted PilT family ATPase